MVCGTMGIGSILLRFALRIETLDYVVYYAS